MLAWYDQMAAKLRYEECFDAEDAAETFGELLEAIERCDTPAEMDLVADAIYVSALLLVAV